MSKLGMRLLVYCTSNVPNHSQSLAFSAIVTGVSQDNVTFNLAEPRWFPSPLKRPNILELVRQSELPKEFEKCGHQGFNIAKIDKPYGENLMRLFGLGPSPGTESEDDGSNVNAPNGLQSYTTDTILADGCFLDEGILESMLHRLRTKRNIILQGPPGAGKTWLSRRLAYALIGHKV